ncbi:MAG: prepilin-type N-terminal cleavage/methylation domain-containing protein [Candidatus Margulisbacteria bacterium]|nr:prepilin-type N-terminal cleavage/methylation domain-containing protein [Candidatus Margulisiibacteriota bacterium]
MAKGFSLIESLIVIGILAILFCIGLPSLSRFQGSVLLESSAKSIASELQFSQSQAQLQHISRTFSSANFPLPKSIGYQSPASLTFSPSGNPQVGGSGSVTLVNAQGKTKKIIVSSLGRIRIE